MYPPSPLINVGKYRKKTTGLSTLKVGGGENLLRVPTFLSGIVAKWRGEVVTFVTFLSLVHLTVCFVESAIFDSFVGINAVKQKVIKFWTIINY